MRPHQMNPGAGGQINHADQAGVEVPSAADHDFIAAARQDVPALVNEVRRIRRIEAIELLREWRNQDPPLIEAIGHALARYQPVDSQEMARRIVDTVIETLEQHMRTAD